MNYPLEQARSELGVFAKVKGDIAQSNFRATFFNAREHVLGKRATMTLSFEETVLWAVELVRRDFPGFEPRLAR